MKLDDVMLLNETGRNAHMAVEAIDAILPKVYDEELAYELGCEKDKYQAFETKAKDRLEQKGVRPKRESLVEKAMLWSGIQANTAFNINTKHVADMLIQGNTKGITQLTRAKNEARHAQKVSAEIAQELIDFEEGVIEKLKAFL